MTLIVFHKTFLDSLISVLNLVLTLKFTIYIICFLHGAIRPPELVQPNFSTVFVSMFEPVSGAFITLREVEIPTTMALVILHLTLLDESCSIRIIRMTLFNIVCIEVFFSVTFRIIFYDTVVTVLLIFDCFKLLYVSVSMLLSTLTRVFASNEASLNNMVVCREYCFALANHQCLFCYIFKDAKFSLTFLVTSFTCKCILPDKKTVMLDMINALIKA